MSLGPSDLRGRAVFWDLDYLSCFTPWDRGKPPDELVELMEGGFVKPCRSLDVGCGTGSTVIYLSGRRFEAHGADISGAALRKAKSKAARSGLNCSFHHVDFTDTETLARSELKDFDLITDVGCYHSISPGEPRARYIRSVLKVSRVGSFFLVWCFLKGSPWSPGPPGVGEREVEKAFSQQFRIVEGRKTPTSFRDELFFAMERVG